VEAAGGGRRQVIVALVLVFLAAGLSSALACPFLTLFLTNSVRASPWQISLFLLAQPLAGVVVSTRLGRLSDGGLARHRVLVLGAAGGCVASLCTAFLRDYWILLGAACTANALAAAVIPQGFALARAQLSDSPRATVATSALRTVYSIAWVGGPPLASLLLTVGGFATLYSASALLYTAIVAVSAAMLSRSTRGPSAPVPATQPVSAAGPAPASNDELVDASSAQVWDRPLVCTIAGFVLLQAALILNVQALPLLVRRNLHLSLSVAGLTLGLCAALEVPAMLGFGALATRRSLRRLVLLGPLFGMGYFVLAAVAEWEWQLLVGQILNSCFISIVQGLGISYVQGMLPGEHGRGSTIYNNTIALGAVAAGGLVGGAAHFGYRSAYVAAATLTAGGFGLLVAGRARSVSARHGTEVGATRPW
jgi:SET family sugar efflux transporter-like MFS transporter